MPKKLNTTLRLTVLSSGYICVEEVVVGGYPIPRIVTDAPARVEHLKMLYEAVGFDVEVAD